jgi:hypothetical protein
MSTASSTLSTTQTSVSDPETIRRPSRVGAVVRLAWVRRKRNSGRHQLQPLEIQAFARRNAPARAVAPPHARHVVGTLGRIEAGENRSVGMMVRKRRRDRQDPCPSNGVGQGPSAEKIRCISTQRWTLRSVRGRGSRQSPMPRSAFSRSTAVSARSGTSQRRFSRSLRSSSSQLTSLRTKNWRSSRGKAPRSR